MRNSRILIIALPLIIILSGLTLYKYVYLGIRAEIASIKDEQSAAKKTLEKCVTIIAERPALEKKLAALKDKVKANGVKFVAGEPISLASANLQEMVKGLVAGRGGSISSERSGKPEDLISPGEKEPAVAKGAAPAAVAGNNKGAKPENPAGNLDSAKIKVLNVSIDASVPDTGALSDVLYSIETRTPYLVVKELDARVRDFREPRELMIKLDVSALYGGK